MKYSKQVVMYCTMPRGVVREDSNADPAVHQRLCSFRILVYFPQCLGFYFDDLPVQYYCAQ